VLTRGPLRCDDTPNPYQGEGIVGGTANAVIAALFCGNETESLRYIKVSCQRNSYVFAQKGKDADTNGAISAQRDTSYQPSSPWKEVPCIRSLQ